MKSPNWSHEFPGAITVCDTKGIVLSMNEKSQKTFEKCSRRDKILLNVLFLFPDTTHWLVGGCPLCCKGAFERLV